MTQFEFVMMVAAVVVAMGLAEIVGGWGRLLRARQGSITFDWLHLGMSLHDRDGHSSILGWDVGL